jgi:hypothetical protein
LHLATSRALPGAERLDVATDDVIIGDTTWSGVGVDVAATAARPLMRATISATDVEAVVDSDWMMSSENYVT